MARFSVILPVKNGGEYVKLCVKSILGQSLPDFSLDVLDNCSSDGTLEWLQKLNDPRINIHLSDIPLTIEENWSRILHLPMNEFMTFLGHDDLLDSNFLEEMDSLIKKHPNASFYQAHFRYINEQGNCIRSCKPMDEEQKASAFLAFFLSGMGELSIGQVIRSKDFVEVGGIPNYPNLLYADFELWMRLLHRGYRASLHTECCSYRIHGSSTTTSSSKLKYYYAYLRLLDYFISLKERKNEFGEIFRKYGLNFFKTYCQVVSHHILQVPHSEREGVRVQFILKEFKERIDLLIPGNDFLPEEIRSIRLGGIIDNTFFLHNLFLMFKKVYNKPIFR